MEDDCLAFPHKVFAHSALRDQRDLSAASMGTEIRRAYIKRQGLIDSERPVLPNGVGDVKRADGRKGETRIGHQREMQGKRQDLGVRHRQLVTSREAAHASIARHTIG